MWKVNHENDPLHLKTVLVKLIKCSTSVRNVL